MRTVLSAAIALGVIGLTGCCPSCPKTMVSLDQLVGEYNANAAQAPRLWARARIEVTLRDPKSKLPFTWGSASPLAAPNAMLLLAKSKTAPLGPHDFALIGREAGVELFRMGSSTADAAYYFWYALGDRSGGFWGRLGLAGAPGVEGLPIDPTQLLAVLSICELPVDFTQPPTVALAMSDDPCAYVATYLDRQPVTGRILFKREIYFRWEEGKPRRPFRVDFLDADGVRVMTARLKDYRPIETSSDAAPVMPTSIEIAWPKEGSRLRIRLSEMNTTKNPDPSVYGFAENLPGSLGADRIRQVDRHVPLEEARP